MAATVQIHEITTNATTGVDKTSGTVRFKDADDTTVNANNPLQVPPSGTNYSYTKKLRPNVTVAPTTSISNLRWYSDGASGFGTGVSVTCKNIGTTWAAAYKTAMTGGADLFTKTSAAPLDGDTTDTGPFTTTGYHGDMIELQMSVASTATNGALAAESLTLAYDEI